MSETRRPAYSAPFAEGGLAWLQPIGAMESLITPEWAWEGSRGAGVKVAVIDSGIDASHPLVGGPVSGYVLISDSPDGLVYDTQPHSDAYGHGTACAGIIRHAAPDCELYSVRVLGPGLSGKGIVFAAGLRWAIENGMDVCSMSLGTTKKDFFGVLHEMADEAYFSDIMLVTAANNMPIPSFPSVYSSVISVGSHAINDPFLFYYNPNPPVEFGAHGVDVRVAWQDGATITATGNSYAAPHLAGVIAKILGKHPGLTVFQMKSILRALAANMSKSN